MMSLQANRDGKTNTEKYIIIIIIIIINLLWRHSTGDQQRLTYIETYGNKENQ